jgi:hypothetical protein
MLLIKGIYGLLCIPFFIVIQNRDDGSGDFSVICQEERVDRVKVI